MEWAYYIGLIGTTIFLLISFWIGAGDLLIYWSFASVLTTVLGSFGALLVATPLDRIKLLPTIMFTIPSKKYSIDPTSVIETLVTFAEKARREGVLSLEDDVQDIPDPFLKRAIQLVVDGTDPEVVKNIMENEITQMENRHALGKKMLDDWGYYAPAFGMLGTLQGLIAMLRRMNDVSSIGLNMSIALITTLYGAFLANLILLPLSSRLDLYNKYDVLMKEMVIEGVLSIQAGDNPTILREKLYSYISYTLRASQTKDKEPKE